MLGLKVNSFKFLTVLSTQDYLVPASCPFYLVPKTEFQELDLFPFFGSKYGEASTELDPTERCNILSLVLMYLVTSVRYMCRIFCGLLKMLKYSVT